MCVRRCVVRGRSEQKGIQCRSQLSWTVYDLRDFPNGDFSISGSYILQNIHIKSIIFPVAKPKAKILP